MRFTAIDLSYSGIDLIDPKKSYTYISNHRDIVLDSAILQTIFYANDIKTSEITFGSNLMHPQIVVDIGKINKIISPNRPLHALEEKIPNDPYFDKLWGMRDIDAPASWSETTGDDSVRVAVLDTGIATGHEDLKDNIDTLNSRCFSPFYAEDAYEDDAGHGTHVSGIIGAVGDNQKGVAGVSWRSKVIAFKVLDANGSGSTSTVIRGLDRLLGLLRSQPALKIAAVNLSLGGYSAESPEEMERDSAEWRAYKALDDTDRIVIVVAAGNEGLEVGEPAPFSDLESLFRPRFRRGEYCYPASFTGLNNMIVVGAMAEGGKGAYFSNWSQTKVDVAAPGMKIYSTTPKGVEGPEYGSTYGLYGFMSGTSMAAPHVAGAAGLLMSKFPTLKAHELKEAILKGAKPSVNPVAKPFPTKSDYQGINPKKVIRSKASCRSIIIRPDLTAVIRYLSLYIQKLLLATSSGEKKTFCSAVSYGKVCCCLRS